MDKHTDGDEYTFAVTLANPPFNVDPYTVTIAGHAYRIHIYAITPNGDRYRVHPTNRHAHCNAKRYTSRYPHT